MKKTPSLLAVSFGVALAAACGGSSSDNGDAGRGGDSASGSGSGGGSGGGSGSGSGSSSGGGSGSSSGAGGGDGGAMMCQCTAPQVCCVGGGGGGGGMRTFSCAANATSCPTRTAAVACTTSQSCGMGQVCCYLGGGGASISQCMASCPAGAREVCMSPADCSVAGSMCSAQTGGVYGFRTCRPPACTSTSCMAGELCCVAGGGTPTCQMGTACAMGDRQVCATNADCPAATPVCRGGPPLTCRTPPMDGGTEAGPVEAGPVEAGLPETGPGDAPSGG
jgi:hypothetical protein